MFNYFIENKIQIQRYKCLRYIFPISSIYSPIHSKNIKTKKKKKKRTKLIRYDDHYRPVTPAKKPRMTPLNYYIFIKFHVIKKLQD